MNTGATILVVDDETNTREGLKRFLEGLDYEVVTARNGKEAADLVKAASPEIVLTDLRMPEMDGRELLDEIKRVSPDTIVILLTAYGTVESAVQAMKAGAYYYLMKPINFEEMELILKKALSQRALQNENVNLREELIRARHESGTIIGESAEIRKLVAAAKQVAQSDSTVLIQGESGTGKELVAHLIHTESARRKQPFVTVHMASMTDTLLASELFGHEKGSYTGAAERKIGRFEMADGGSLFLDEVGDIPETMQVKLLRVLQSGEFERVGGTKTIRSDVRIICATHKDLELEVKNGRFRGDLFYRINVIFLHIPPLRERRTDIPLIAAYYLKYFSERNRKRIERISPESLRVLSAYPWPGNVRELKNIMERIVVLSDSGVIEEKNLPADLKRSGVVSAKRGGELQKPGNTIQEAEEAAIRRAMSESSFNKSLAAKKLGISRRTLYRKIADYQIGES